jgi:hypothetical protein
METAEEAQQQAHDANAASNTEEVDFSGLKEWIRYLYL